MSYRFDSESSAQSNPSGEWPLVYKVECCGETHTVQYRHGRSIRLVDHPRHLSKFGERKLHLDRLKAAEALTDTATWRLPTTIDSCFDLLLRLRFTLRFARRGAWSPLRGQLTSTFTPSFVSPEATRQYLDPLLLTAERLYERERSRPRQGRRPQSYQSLDPRISDGLDNARQHRTDRRLLVTLRENAAFHLKAARARDKHKPPDPHVIGYGTATVSGRMLRVSPRSLYEKRFVEVVDRLDPRRVVPSAIRCRLAADMATTCFAPNRQNLDCLRHVVKGLHSADESRHLRVGGAPAFVLTPPGWHRHPDYARTAVTAESTSDGAGWNFRYRDVVFNEEHGCWDSCPNGLVMPLGTLSKLL